MYKDMDTHEGMLLWRECLHMNINSLVSCEHVVRESHKKRPVKLYPLFSSIIEDAISLDILASNSRLNQSYIISRALLERVINFCYLLYASDEEYSSFVDYTKNKAARSLSRKIETNGTRKVSLEFSGGNFELPQDYKDAVERFTSERGREIPRWTKLSVDKRADFLDKKTGKNLLLHILMIYSDASEALHGTIYGSLFHLGVYNPGSVPKDQDTLDKHRNNTLSFLYFMGSSAIGTLLYCLLDNDVDVRSSFEKADASFNSASEESGLLNDVRQSRKV